MSKEPSISEFAALTYNKFLKSRYVLWYLKESEIHLILGV